MMGSTKRLLVAAIGLAGASVPLQAQQSAPDSIPRELAMALLNASGAMQLTDLRVGRLPDDFPTGVLPGTAIVLGSGIQATRGTALTLVALPIWPVAAAADTLRARLVANGWMPAQTNGPTWMQIGFVDPSDAPPSYNYCRGRTMIHLQERRAEPGPSQIGLTQGGDPSVLCVDSRPAPAGLDSPAIPTLLPPPGAQVSDSKLTPGSRDLTFRADLASHLDAVAVRRFYAAQLVTAGWVQVDSATSAGLATAALRFADSGGRQWAGILNVLTTGTRGLTQLVFWMRER
jgi:hypothetical protein